MRLPGREAVWASACAPTSDRPPGVLCFVAGFLNLGEGRALVHEHDAVDQRNPVPDAFGVMIFTT